jgi:hypothetical protein
LAASNWKLAESSQKLGPEEEQVRNKHGRCGKGQPQVFGAAVHRSHHFGVVGYQENVAENWHQNDAARTCDQ